MLSRLFAAVSLLVSMALPATSTAANNASPGPGKALVAPMPNYEVRPLPLANDAPKYTLVPPAKEPQDKTILLSNPDK